jgi:hypothetical protein
MVAVGSRKVGSTPQTSLLGCAGKKESGLNIPETKESHVLGSRNRLRDYRRDPAQDQVPVLAYPHRNHRLDVQHILRAAGRTDVEVVYVLNRNADQTGNRILHRLLQLLGISLICCLCRHRFQQKTMAPESKILLQCFEVSTTNRLVSLMDLMGLCETKLGVVFRFSKIDYIICVKVQPPEPSRYPPYSNSGPPTLGRRCSSEPTEQPSGA